MRDQFARSSQQGPQSSRGAPRQVGRYRRRRHLRLGGRLARGREESRSPAIRSRDRPVPVDFSRGELGSGFLGACRPRKSRGSPHLARIGLPGEAAAVECSATPFGSSGLVVCGRMKPHDSASPSAVHTTRVCNVHSGSGKRLDQVRFS